MSSRRQFLKMLSSAVLPPMVLGEMKAGETKPSRIPLAFSTLGCPAWGWKKILDFAAQHGFAAIELRGLEGKLDLPALPTFAPDRIEQSQKEIRDSKLRIASEQFRANVCRGSGQAGKGDGRRPPVHWSGRCARSAVRARCRPMPRKRPRVRVTLETWLATSCRLHPGTV